MTAQAFHVQLPDTADAATFWQPLGGLLAGPLPWCLALGLDSRDPPSPQAQTKLLAALASWLPHPRWFRPWGRPLLLVLPLADPQAQAFWLQRLRGTGAQLLELHHARPPASQADGVVLLHPHGEPPLPDQAPSELLALQSPTYGPLGPQEHRAVWLDPAIAWRQWRAHARANTALHAHHRPGLVVLQLPPGQPLPDLTPPPAPAPRPPLERAVVVHAFHLELLEPILQRLEALVASEGAVAPATELFCTAPEAHLPALGPRLAALPLPSHLVPVANHGRDLYPFLQLLPELIARRAQLVLKLHTKRSSHLQPGSLVRVRDGAAWREGLLDGLLDPAAHAALRRRLAEAGDAPCLLAPEAFLWPVEVSMGPSAPRLTALLAEQGLELSALRGRRFPAGSMFACNQA
ncbi:MAG: rhamnan synthesis F family protein, partial [Prochlorococcaceae cyanobacterium]